MFDGFSNGYCPQCALDDRQVAMLLNMSDYWACPVCHLQAAGSGAYFMILRKRGEDVPTSSRSPRLATGHIRRAPILKQSAEDQFTPDGRFQDEADLCAFLENDVQREASTFAPSDKAELWRVVGKNSQGLEKAMLTLPGGVDMAFVKMPAGRFLMGSPSNEESREDDEGPQHQVSVGSYWLAETVTTQAQWIAMMGSDPILPFSFAATGDDLPVEITRWNDCWRFIRRLNAVGVSGRFRLPSEAEWEYACRAGTTTPFYFGDDDAQLGEHAWDDEELHPVRQKRSNAWGLFDMHGNVWEWCQDWDHDDYQGAPTDGSAWESGATDHRVLRGGWWFGPESLRSAYRGGFTPDFPGNVGFRVAKTP